MFQTTTINSSISHWPKAAGLGVVAAFCAGAVVAPLFYHALLDFKVFTPPVTVISLKEPKKAPRPKPVRRYAKRREGGVVSGTPEPIVIARADSDEWRAQVERGRTLDFEIEAFDSLPVLTAHGVKLAFDYRRPRGKAYVFDLGTASASTQTVASGMVIRELREMPPDVKIEAAKRKAEHELGQAVRIFALYPPELYDALRGYTETALLRAGIQVESVRLAHVVLQLSSGRDFRVRLQV